MLSVHATDIWYSVCIFWQMLSLDKITVKQCAKIANYVRENEKNKQQQQNEKKKQKKNTQTTLDD